MEKISCPLCNEGVLSEWAPQYVKDAWKCNAAKCQAIFKTTDWHLSPAEGRIVMILSRLNPTVSEFLDKYEIEITPE